MGTASYILAGTTEAMELSFGSCCHGAGEHYPAMLPKHRFQGKKLKIDLEEQGIFIQAGSISDLAEEAPLAYKNIHDVVDVVDKVGIAKRLPG